MDQARCRPKVPGAPPRAFFFPRIGSPGEQAACAYCEPCPVREECLDYALANDTADLRFRGVAGGMTPRQRAALVGVS